MTDRGIDEKGWPRETDPAAGARPARRGVCGALAGLLLMAACAKTQAPPGPAAAREGGSSPATPAKLLPEDRVRLSNDPAKTEIFRDAGLGLFIHWGPNSQVGTEISWPLFNATDEYIKKYYALAETFNPVRFDAAEWARLAKTAGMEYVVFTAKHHDGFCMFDTALSDFKVTRTPYGKDVVARIVDAFRREGFLIGLYYSPGDFRYQFETGVRTGHIYEPQFDATAPFGPLRKGFLDYERGHLEELLANYGDIFMVWFDGTCDPLKKHAWRLKQDIFIARGEIPTPEQEIPGKPDDRAWESCLTTSWQWAWQPNADVRTAREVIWNLIHIRARGGNMLLNVGPRPDGRIADADESLLRELGLWMMLYGEAVRGVRPWTTTNEDGVWLTSRRSDGTVYALADLVFGFDGTGNPDSQGVRFTLKSVKATPETKVTMLSQAGDCEWTQGPDGLTVTAVRKHTIQLIRTPEGTRPPAPGKTAGRRRDWTWGPNWPVALKITNAGR